MPPYEQLKRLGSGAFGDVWLVLDRALGIEVAVKYVSPDRIKDPTNFYQEPQTLVQLRHNNIVTVMNAGTTKTGRLYIAMEYLSRGSLEDIWQGGVVPARSALRYIRDACNGVEHAHGLGFIHHDIKPANIILADDDTAKLSDFGLATRAAIDGTAGAYGYRAHLAPEVFIDKTTSRASDIYALGVTLYRLVNGDALLPTYSGSADLESQIVRGRFPNRAAYRPFVPRSLRTVINRAMNVDPSKRYGSASDLRHALEQVQLVCDWTSQVTPGGRTWSTRVDKTKTEFEVTTGQEQAGYTVTARKGRIGQTKRRITADCAQGLALDQLASHVARLLQRIATSGQ